MFKWEKKVMCTENQTIVIAITVTHACFFSFAIGGAITAEIICFAILAEWLPPIALCETFKTCAIQCRIAST